MPESELKPTLADIQVAMNSAWTKMEAILPGIGPVLDSGPNASGWTPRELLSHMVGAWQRVPMHSAFFRDGVDVPIQVADACWTPEWATAPLSAFQTCLEAGYDSNKAFLSRVKEPDLAIHGTTPFGEISLGEFLMLSYAKHLDEFHVPQLEEFARRA